MMLSFFRQFAERTESSSSSTLRNRFRLILGSKGRASRMLGLGLGLLEVDEKLKLVLQDARGVRQRHSSGRDGAVGHNLHSELVVVEDLTFTRVFDLDRSHASLRD